MALGTLEDYWREVQQRLGQRMAERIERKIMESLYAVALLRCDLHEGSLRILRGSKTDSLYSRVDSVSWEVVNEYDLLPHCWLRWIFSAHCDRRIINHVFVGRVTKNTYTAAINLVELELDQFTLITVPNGVDAQEVLDWEWSLHQAEPGDRDYARAIYSDWCESHGMTMRAKQLRNGKA